VPQLPGNPEVTGADDPNSPTWWAVEGAPGPRAIGIGELLWDLLPSGPRLGGAPFNVTAHLQRLGFDAAFVTAVGHDALGYRARDEVARLGVETMLLQVNDLPTGVVDVRLDGDGNADYLIVSPAAYEAIEPLADAAIEAIGRVDVLVFGTLAQRFPGTSAATRQLADAQPAAERIYDVNLRAGCWTIGLVSALLRLATVVKLNDTEAAILARELRLPDESPESFARATADRFDVRGVCVTRGAGGAAMLLDGRYAEIAGVAVEVADTVGAGDAFTAGLAAGLVDSWPLDRVLGLANRLGAFVASRDGAIPDWHPADLGLTSVAREGGSLPTRRA
jgi:fructokinase